MKLQSALQAVLPVARTPVAMGDCQNRAVGWENRVHHDKRELVDRVSSAPGEIGRPTIRSISDLFIARSNALSKPIAAAGLLSEYQAKAPRYSFPLQDGILGAYRTWLNCCQGMYGPSAGIVR